VCGKSARSPHVAMDIRRLYGPLSFLGGRD
jgi:hypothetical protein